MMRQNHRFYYHEGISIESSPPALLLAYADADQGGTRLQYHYRIYYTEDPNTHAKVTVTCGYAHDQKHRTKEITLSDIHHSVISDALTWLKKQLRAAEQSPNKNYQKVFNRFINIVETQNTS